MLEFRRHEDGPKRGDWSLAGRVAALERQLARARADLARERAGHRLARERVSSLVRDQSVIVAHERRRVARELHDQLGQEVTALRMNLARLRASCAPDAEMAQHTTRVEELAERLDDRLDHLTRALHEPDVQPVDLSAALTRLTTEWSATFGTPAVWTGAGRAPIVVAADVATHVCCIAREALHNVVKHAGASRVHVSALRRRGRLTMRIEDDGIGFEPEASRHAGALGLISMHERASLLGGALELRTSSRGTTVVLDVTL